MAELPTIDVSIIIKDESHMKLLDFLCKLRSENIRLERQVRELQAANTRCVEEKRELLRRMKSNG